MTLFSSALLSFSLSLMACGGGEPAPEPATKAPEAGKAAKTKEKEKAPPAKCPEPKQEVLKGPKAPALVVGQAWFVLNEDGMPTPCPARMILWRDRGEEGWVSTTVEDPDSNVFHKVVMQDDGSLLTIGAERALLKRWTPTAEGWSQETLWEKSWGGKFNRLRDIEIGDVDGDGKDEYVIATHDAGVIAVYNPEDGAEGVIELDEKADTFVHEIEIGDINGDGKLEFFGTPTDRNKVGESQKGDIVMYRFEGGKYQRTVVEARDGTHAKEILTFDVDGDGKDELFSVFEAELGKNKEIITPVQVRQYLEQPDGSFKVEVRATIQDSMTRFLVGGDIDGDGKNELIAAAKKSGIWVMEPGKDGSWETVNIEKKSSGFEHVAFLADLQKDPKKTPELYVAADDQQSLTRYVYNPETKSYDKTKLDKLPKGFTWNMDAGQF